VRPLGFVFVGDRPAREARGRAEQLALLEAVDLDDHAVGLVRQAAALAVELRDEAEQLADVGAHALHAVRGQAERGQRGQRLGVAGIVALDQLVEEHAQPALAALAHV
jgi:hypothetical protein